MLIKNRRKIQLAFGTIIILAYTSGIISLVQLLVLGLILGVLFALFTYTELFSTPMKSFLSTGMMGALTTYSTFALETFWLFNGGSFALGLTNIVLNVVATVISAGTGFKAIEYFLK